MGMLNLLNQLIVRSGRERRRKLGEGLVVVGRIGWKRDAIQISVQAFGTGVSSRNNNPLPSLLAFSSFRLERNVHLPILARPIAKT
jgi:hypothetical protein